MKSGWKKNLYENSNFPDNYTDETFLKDLEIKIENKEITLHKSIIGASAIVEELCVVISFVLVFVYLLNEWIEPSTVFASTSLLTFLGFLYYRVCNRDSETSFRQDIRTLLIFLVFGQIFSPVLHTLTDTVSTDTIYTMTALMMFTHLVFFDYGLSVAIVSSSLSLSAAMFGSICLASRLTSPYHAFVLMTVAVEAFVLFPILRAKLNCAAMPSIFTIFTVSLTLLQLLYTVSITMTLILTVTLVFINFICPFTFVRWQKHKINIYGPWDEAIVQDVDNLNQLKSI